jgi:(p)ppGpp synthase/HD superfamily hydrolase
MSDLTYERRLSALRGHLRGAGFTMALEALEYARGYHCHRRKDGQHEFSHQVAIAFHVLDLPGLLFPEETIATVMLHDTVEDYGQHHEAVILNRFGARVHSGVMSVTKKIPVFVDGVKVHVIERDEAELFAAMSGEPIGSIVKPADRGHNQKTMGGAFTQEKQVSYVDFTDELIIPMMKRARHLFPQQYRAYMLLQDKLESQAALVRSWSAAKAA